MNQVKNKRKSARSTEHNDNREHGMERSARSYGSEERYSDTGGTARAGSMQQGAADWDYQKVKEVVGAVYTLASLFLNNEQKQRIDKINRDVSSILGVRSLGEWEPPQPLLNIIGLSGGQGQSGYHRAA
jgi:hypothetical protein